MKILIYNSGGGIGDSIQLIPLLNSLKENFKITNEDIYYLGAHLNHFTSKLKNFDINIKTLDLKLKYFGFRWWHFFLVKKRCEELKLNTFDLVIDLQSKIRNTLILRRIPAKTFYSPTFNFFFSNNSKNYIKNKNFIKETLFNLEKIYKKQFLSIDFDIKKIDKKYIVEAERLLPNNNYFGFSITQGNVYRKKNWPLEKFIEVANKIIKMNLTPVFFIEKNNMELMNKIKEKVNHAEFPEHNSQLNSPLLVTALATRLKKSLTIDNGVMHMINLAKTPMIVLFGPTNSEKFVSIRENINVLDSKKIYNSSDITKITTEDVLNLI
jgi:ADP-heptose:LPS heptosyltransferase